MEQITLPVEKRELVGKHVKQLRKKGQLPAVLYGHNVEPVLLTVDRPALEKLFRDAGSSTLVTLSIAGEDRNVLIKDVATDPVSGEALHVDFYQVKMSEKITTSVPLHFEGEAPAAKNLGGTLVKNKDELEIECLPANLPHHIEVDVSGLVDFEGAIHVKDLSIPQGVEVLDDVEEVVAFVEAPRSEEELAELEEAPTEEELPEVVGKEAGEEKEEEGEEGAAESREPADTAE